MLKSLLPGGDFGNGQDISKLDNGTQGKPQMTPHASHVTPTRKAKPMTNAQKDLLEYVNKQIQVCLTKGAHRFTPTKNFTEILSTTIAESFKHEIHVKSHENTILLARKPTANADSET